jgi:hypothetical protein
MQVLRCLVRKVAVAALAVATSVAAGAVALGPAGPAWASVEEVFLEVAPSTVQAGMQVQIRAKCGDTPQRATVSSRAFPDVRLEPPAGSTIMTGHATVPTSTRPDTYQVRLRCTDGAFATVDLHVIDMARPSLAPATGGGGTAGGQHAALWMVGGGAAAFAAGLGLLLLRRRQPS